ncbi:hypothetical protein Smic_51110 [Streptomyces microflavus]|uniref:Uncharacterized protein n=1 Tax=Streptomyces microflavus TaxID=1919 RepID=A0A7J0CXT6_STRMI|nr:hypothetical protein Smic_51110 [Streptomyces microflavus]
MGGGFSGEGGDEGGGVGVVGDVFGGGGELVEHAVHVGAVEGVGGVEGVGFVAGVAECGGDVLGGVGGAGYDGGVGGVDGGDVDVGFVAGEVGRMVCSGAWMAIMVPPGAWIA